jgi:D-alanyl-lipoteichoic acid acyltransferase DltB (MBOAT superfamily)
MSGVAQAARGSATNGSTTNLLAQELPRFLFVLGQLGLAVLVIRQFQIESSAFLRVFLLATAGFAVHYFLPRTWKLPFFVLLSLTSILLVMGAVTGVALIGIGLVLIGICHLPIAWTARIALLVASGVVLAVLRTEIIQLPWSNALWPILGSMFMFRLLVYVYDFRHDKVPPDFWSSLGYFFMLPNVCFPLFPVVDYKTFRRQYLDRDPFEIYLHGVTWIVRGLSHLLLYRIVYYYFTLAPHEVVDADTLMQFLLANFMLYLRISGYFHLIVGMLYLFGFRQPETHHRYVLSSSFTEFWRRINIYWKDFMMKILYYPVYFRVRRHGSSLALIVATALVFLGTWFAHSYQWFWLRGSFPVVWQDILFWGVLAVLVIFNALREVKHGRKRTLDDGAWSTKEMLALGAKTVGTFFAIILLWSLWTSESWASWVSMWRFLEEPSNIGVPAYFLGTVIVIFVGAMLFGRQRKAADDRSKVLAAPLGIELTWTSTRSLVLLFVIAAASLPQVYTRFGPDASNFVLSLRSDQLSPVDAASLQRGYYEDLTRVDRFNSQLWEVYSKKPLNWLDATGSGLTRFTGDFRKTELIPSYQSTTSFSVITTNRWGMRDRKYELVPAPGTFRIAMLGASNVMGWGVEDDETFEALFEEKLNIDLVGDRWQRFESLNLGVPGYYPLQQLPTLEKALEFQPDAFYYIATGRELSRGAYYLAEFVTEGGAPPYPELQRIADAAGLADASDLSDGLRRLRPYQGELLDWLYRELVAQGTANGTQSVFVFLPQLERGDWEDETAETLSLAENAGFHIIDMSDIYDGLEGSLAIAEWDNHPNARGHELIAERLAAETKRLWPEIQRRASTTQ